MLGLALIFIFNFRVDGIFIAFIVVPFILDALLFREFSLFRVLKTNKPEKKLFSQLFKYGSKLSISFLAFWILSFSDRYLIEYFASSDQVGFYSVGYAISEKTLNFLYTILMLAAYPIIIDNWENHGKEYTSKLITELTKYFFIFCMPVLAMLIMIPEKVLSLFASQTFIPGAKVLPLIACGIFINGLSQYVIKGFELYKKTNYIAVIALSVSILNIVLNIILIPRLGILGAAFSSCLSYLVYFVFAYLGTRSFMVFLPPWRTIGVVVFASTLFSFILWLGKIYAANSYYLFLIVAPVGVVIYFSVLFLFGEFNISFFKLLKGKTQ